jgi:hypothetical protein
MDIWSFLRTLEIFYEHLVYFTPFWHIVPRKIWQPWPPTVDAKIECLEMQIFIFQRKEEPILRLLHLQLQRQRCSRLERFKVEYIFLDTCYAISCAVKLYNAGVVFFFFFFFFVAIPASPTQTM